MGHFNGALETLPLCEFDYSQAYAQLSQSAITEETLAEGLRLFLFGYPPSSLVDVEFYKFVNFPFDIRTSISTHTVTTDEYGAASFYLDEAALRSTAFEDRSTMYVDASHGGSSILKTLTFTIDRVAYSTPSILGNGDTLTDSNYTVSWTDPSPKPGRRYDTYRNDVDLGPSLEAPATQKATGGNPTDGSTIKFDVYWWDTDQNPLTNKMTITVTAATVAPSGIVLNTPPLRNYGLFQDSDWDNFISPLDKVYASNTDFVSVIEEGGERLFEMKLERASNGSARNHMQAFLPSTAIGYETTEWFRLKPGFSFGDTQKAAKIGLAGIGMRSHTLNPIRTPGGSDNASDGFSLRTMYATSFNQGPSTPVRTHGYYYGHDRNPTYGSSGEYLYMDGGPVLQEDVWYKVHKKLQLNSGPNNADGIIQISINDVMYVDQDDRQMLGPGADFSRLWVWIHETFWGGNTLEYAGLNTSYIQYRLPVIKLLT